jgi:hypothetical protein
VGADLFHVDGQTDITKVIVAFRNFTNVPRKDASNHINFFTMARTFPLLQYTTPHDVSETTCLHLVVLVLRLSVCIECCVSSPGDGKISFHKSCVVLSVVTMEKFLLNMTYKTHYSSIVNHAVYLLYYDINSVTRMVGN